MRPQVTQGAPEELMSSPVSKLGLGSGQFGLDQAPVRGRSAQAEVRDILEVAARAGVRLFDVTGRSVQAERARAKVGMPRQTECQGRQQGWQHQG